MNRVLTPIVLAYIDPGTGSMLFTIFIGLISVFVYFFRSLMVKIKYSFTGKISDNSNSIPFVVYSDDKRYDSTFKPILDEFEKRKQELVYYTQSIDDDLLKENYEFVKREYIGDNNRSFGKLNMLNADIVLSTTPSLDVYQWKRSKDVKYYVHVLHAASDVTLYKMFGIDYYDALILSGQFQVQQVRQLEKLRNLKEKELVILGVPYLDELLKKAKKSKTKAKETTVLLAPSWGDNAILNKYGESIIDALIKTGYKIIIRPHPQSYKSEKTMLDNLMNKYPTNKQLSWNNDNDNFDALSKADILISDFSGVIFDYALVFNRPVIYADTSFDKGVYDAYWLDEELWTFKALEKIGKKLKNEDIKDIKSLIDECLKSKTLQKGIENIKDECFANQGKSAKLIVDYLIAKRDSLINGENK